MRWVLGTLAVCLTVGCRTPSSTLSNPFMAPDRVPPPSTRTLLPGTAQPYYPGDPVPQSPAIRSPTIGVAPSFTPLPTQNFAPQPAQTLPPNGWNTTPQNRAPQPTPAPVYPSNASPYQVRPTSATLPVEPAVQVANDQQGLRFNATTPQNFAPQPAPTVAAPSVVPTWSQPTPTIQPPTIPPSGAQFARFEVQQPSSPPFGTVTNRPVEIRAITGEQLRQRDRRQRNRPSRDGFRPQGSSRRDATPSATRSISYRVGPSDELAERFGFDPQYRWLRGRLETDEVDGRWKLRYMPVGGSRDQLGGSVVIANPRLLGDPRPGDYVLLRGRLHANEADPRSLAPVYTVSVVQRQQI